MEDGSFKKVKPSEAVSHKASTAQFLNEITYYYYNYFHHHYYLQDYYYYYYFQDYYYDYYYYYPQGDGMIL